MYEIMRVFTVPLTFSKEEFVASSHEDGQNVLQFQTEDIRRWWSILYVKDKLLMIFYIAK